MSGYEYRVEEESFGKPKDTEKSLNILSAQGWEFFYATTLGPIPTRWLYFRRPKQDQDPAPRPGPDLVT